MEIQIEQVLWAFSNIAEEMKDKIDTNRISFFLATHTIKELGKKAEEQEIIKELLVKVDEYTSGMPEDTDIHKVIEHVGKCSRAEIEDKVPEERNFFKDRDNIGETIEKELTKLADIKEMIDKKNNGKIIAAHCRTGIEKLITSANNRMNTLHNIAFQIRMPDKGRIERELVLILEAMQQTINKPVQQAQNDEMEI